MSGFKLNKPPEKTDSIWQQPLCNFCAAFTSKQYRQRAAAVTALKIKKYVEGFTGYRVA